MPYSQILEPLILTLEIVACLWIHLTSSASNIKYLSNALFVWCIVPCFFGVADPIAINGEQFWRNGKYDAAALENVYVLDHARAKQRVDVIIEALSRYESDLSAVKGIGFCVTIKHVLFMAEQFTLRGIPSGAFISIVEDGRCQDLLDRLKIGRLTFLFTVDKLCECVDFPEVNTVLFLRPTESLTVFSHQLGRGLRGGSLCLNNNQ